MEAKYHSPRIRHRHPHAFAGAPATFAALRVLSIDCSTFDAAEMERLVSTLCPQLQDLTLVTHLDGVISDFSVRSESLEQLDVRVAVGVAGQLVVEAPRLVQLALSGCFRNPSRNPQNTARVTAPKLTEVTWRDVYNPLGHHFVEASRNLRELQVWPRYMEEKDSRWKKLVVDLLRRFNAVDELEDCLVLKLPSRRCAAREPPTRRYTGQQPCRHCTEKSPTRHCTEEPIPSRRTTGEPPTYRIWQGARRQRHSDEEERGCRWGKRKGEWRRWWEGARRGTAGRGEARRGAIGGEGEGRCLWRREGVLPVGKRWPAVGGGEGK
uniref:F-box/LRR-repeat protein 15/At3g58940/PEG3-like LRR domain-containing protein n=1 Tax=Oryza punctata TaxID=4537 RepID=A0A0E0LM03_ORYPU